MTNALLRQPSPLMASACELTHMGREAIDMEVAARQHVGYASALHALGVTVATLPPLEGHADCAFVEDTFIRLPEVAIQCRPGTASRRGEVASVAAALTNVRIFTINAPSTIEGGDVLRVGRTLYVGQTTRTNAAGIAALTAIVSPFGYAVIGVKTSGTLHLKTACTALPSGTFLANLDWFDPAPFGDADFIVIDKDEPFAGNTLTIGETILFPAAHPRTAAKVAALGFETALVDISEFAKAEAGLTCLSLIW